MGLLKGLLKGAKNIVKEASKAAGVGGGKLKDVADSMKNPNGPGVYILKLNGRIMKVGSAEIGIQKRMQQYYGLNTHCGLNKYINKDNRDYILVKWQACPANKCRELEAKLFDKYGENLPWSERRPRCDDDTIKLLI